MSKVSAIDTHYNGYWFRSRLEARWAIFFDHMHLPYQYEPEGFDLNGLKYLPDFYLEEGIKLYGEQERRPKVWVEIKPLTELDTADKQKIARFVQQTNNEVLLVSGDPGPGASIRLISHKANGNEWSTPFLKWVELSDGELGLLDPLVLEGIGDPDTKAAVERLIETPTLIAAYRAARQARFEHGESPIGGSFTGTKNCESCGKLFTPLRHYNRLCDACILLEKNQRQSSSVSVSGGTLSKQSARTKKDRKWIYGLGALILVLVLLAIGFALMTLKEGGDEATAPVSSPAAVQPLLGSEPTVVPTQVDAELTPASVQEVQLEPTPICKCSRNLYDCDDFETHDEAQACFDFCFEESGDIHYLDSNDDREACENLP